MLSNPRYSAKYIIAADSGSCTRLRFLGSPACRAAFNIFSLISGGQSLRMRQYLLRQDLRLDLLRDTQPTLNTFIVIEGLGPRHVDAAFGLSPELSKKERDKTLSPGERH